MQTYDYLIVGAGLFGATFAWHARQKGKRVLVVEKRQHIAGNCYTHLQEGINVHTYGPHIFHTNDEEIWQFINRFATFNSYVHRVKARFNDKVYTMPMCLATMNQLWGITTPEQAHLILQEIRQECSSPKNMEEWALSQVGTELYETLVKTYTTKQWGRPPSELPASILKRLPIRTSWDDRYFEDKYQGIPIGGYTKIFEGLLEGCDVRLGVDYLSDMEQLNTLAEKIVYTGPIDAYYSYALGQLEYRSLSFETKVIDVPDYQGCAIVNWTGPEVPWTRTVEHKHFDRVDTDKTVVTWETPKMWTLGAEPFYPINDDANNARFREYNELAKQEPRTLFGGRMGSYRYMDMHQVIAQAMHLAKKEGLKDA
jgi:UDP-galactopyranose mutase